MKYKNNGGKNMYLGRKVIEEVERLFFLDNFQCDDKIFIFKNFKINVFYYLERIQLSLNDFLNITYNEIFIFFRKRYYINNYNFSYY